ncbi:Npt1/Npt2 family nucleotide transporter [Changchengzhania lutea]|uniref:Npt1/Npt2 family nucleotide transporter n=1 Tax=Changchengzhania lutea TaxID=2049305 RepID=UPI00115D2FD3|nr:Npt1/Npt2 family nucleotide transporter [Changchengzhania lutea]
MQLYIFLVITVLLIVKPTVNALFLSRLGADSLPYGYIIVAIVAVITTYYYNKAAIRFALVQVTTITLIFFSLSFIALCAILNFGVLNKYILYAYYVGVSLFAVIATSQFWILANIVFNSREAKRLFGFIGAGAIAGGVFGGYLTSIIVSAFNNVTAILVAAILILCCIPIMHKIWSLRIKKLNTYVRKQRKYTDSNGGESALKIISKSKHLTYLAIITGLGVVVAKLVDFQFSDFANKAILDPDKLASFFGFWFSTFNVLALILQLFLTNKLLSKLGVSTTLLILPLGIAIGSLLFITFPELWVLIIIKGIDGSFKQSVNKAAVELSIMPIPFHIKNQAKSFIDVAVDSIATGLAGLMLIFLIRKLDLDTTYITVIILLFTFAWIVLIYKLREAYFNSFRINIQRNLTTEALNKKESRKENTISYSRRILRTGSEDAILNMLDQISQYKINALKPEIIALLDFPSILVKIEAIKQLYAYDKGTAINKVKSLIISEDDELVYTALEYILEHSYLNKNEFFNQYLDHESRYISGAALLCLAKEASDNKRLSEAYNLEKRIADKVKSLHDDNDVERKEEIAKLLITIAYSGLRQYYPFINLNLNHKKSYIVKHAIKAAGITVDESYIEVLIRFLKTKTYRNIAIKSLKRYGSEITKTFIKLDRKEELGVDAKRYIPKIVQSYNTQGAVKVLIRLLKSKDVIIRFESAKSLIKLKSKSEHLYFNKRLFNNAIINESKYVKDTLDIIASIQYLSKGDIEVDTPISAARESLIGVLEEQLETSLQCIFKLLSLVYEEADINVSYSGLISEVKEARINALEFLDNLLQSQLKSRVLPLVEYYIVDESEVNNSRLKLNIIPESAYIKLLIRKRGKRIKLELLKLIEILKNKSYIPTVASLTKHQNKDIRFTAIETLKELKKL